MSVLSKTGIEFFLKYH